MKIKTKSISIQASRSEYRVIFDRMNRKLIPYGTKLPVALHAVVDGKRFRLNLSLDAIEDLQGHVAAEADHTTDGKFRKRLDKYL